MAHRIERVNSLIRQEISDLLLQHIKDPRLEGKFVTVNEVDTSADLKFAKVFISSIDAGDEKDKVLKAMESRFAAGDAAQPSLVDLRFPESPYYRFADEGSGGR